MANGSGAAVVGLVIGVILAAEAAGWGGDDGDGLSLESGDSDTGQDTTSGEPDVPTSVNGGATARPDDALITVTDRSGRTVELAVPWAAGPDIASEVMGILADHHVHAAHCPDVTDSHRHPLCDATTRVVVIGVGGDEVVSGAIPIDGIVDALSDEGFAAVSASP
ncbi:MAG: hypothetical protein ACRDVN_09190 [Jiangellaceae bacterium]